MNYVLRVMVVTASLLGAFSLLYEVMVRADDRTIDQMSRFQAANVNPEVVLFGDSRGVYGYRHSEMDNAYFNLSYFSEDYRIYVLKLNAILRVKPGIKAIVIPFDRYGITSHRDNNYYLRTLYFSDLALIEDLYREYHSNLFKDLARYYFPVLDEVERTRLWKTVTNDLARMLEGGRNQNSMNSATVSKCPISTGLSGSIA